MTFVLDLRSRNIGGGVTSGVLRILNGPEGETALDQLRLASRVVFLAHGFNVNRSDGREKLSHLAEFIDAPADMAVVAVLWPGDSVIPVVTFPFEGKTANDSAAALARFILERNALRPGTSISVVTHSLGARVGMEAFKRLLGASYPLSQVCLMAPAVVDYALARPQDYLATTEACERVTVLSSVRDRVLQFAFPVGNLLEVFPLFRRTTLGLALGYHGPRSDPGSYEPVPQNVVAEAISPAWDVGHGDYLPDFSPRTWPSPATAKQERQWMAALFAADTVKGVTSWWYRHRP